MKKILIAVLLLGSSFLSFAQTELGNGLEPVAIPMKNGVLVYLGLELPKEDFSYVIERKDNSSNFKKIGQVSAADSEGKLKKIQQDNKNNFPALEPLKEEELTEIWEYMSVSAGIDSLAYYSNVPMSLLLTGTAYFDETAKEGEEYSYKITLKEKKKDVWTKTSNVSTSLLPRKFSNIELFESRFIGGKISATWISDTLLTFNSFNVYRSVAGESKYKRLSQDEVTKGSYFRKDTLFLLMIDSVGTDNFALYDYQISPVDFWGREGEKQGFVNQGNTKDGYAPQFEYFNVESAKEDHQVHLSWKFEQKKYLRGVSIMRSKTYDGEYQEIATLPIFDTIYTDILPITGLNYYYYISILSDADEPTNSIRRFISYTGTSELATPPFNVTAETIEDGVKIKWEDQNLFSSGFFVYRSDNGVDYNQISGLVTAKDSNYYYFEDKTDGLIAGRFYQYHVKTVSQDESLSESSEITGALPGLELEITAPINLRYDLKYDVVSLKWDDMANWGGEHIVGFKVLRKLDDGEWKVLVGDRDLVFDNFYKDTTAHNTGIYTYAVVSLGVNGEESPYAEVAIEKYDKILPPPPGIEVISLKDGVYISWGEILGEEIKEVKVYRSEVNGDNEETESKFIGNISGDDSFIDKEIGINKLYYYQLSSVNFEGKEGQRSEKIAVQIYSSDE